MFGYECLGRRWRFSRDQRTERDQESLILESTIDLHDGLESETLKSRKMAG